MPKFRYNVKTNILASIMGSITGFAGIGHGILAMSNGYTFSDSFFLSKAGSFSIITNYLISGLIALVFGIFIIIWSIAFIHRKYGSQIFIICSFIMVLIGGGIAPIIYAPFTLIVSLKIYSRKAPKISLIAFTKYWFSMLLTGFILLFLGLNLLFIMQPTNEFYSICTIFGCIFILISALLQFATYTVGYKIDNSES
jgi:hypothetical protein